MANKQVKRKSLLGVIMRLALIPSVSLGVILAVTASLIATTQLYNQYVDEADALARAYATAIENQITDLALNLNAVTNEDIVFDDNATVEEKKAMLTRVASATTFKDYSLAYADGTTLNNTDLSQREYFQQAMSTKSHYVSSPVLRMTDNTLTIMMGKYFTRAGKDYVAYGGLDIGTFNDVIGKVHFGENGLCYILDKNGMVIASSSDLIPVMTELKGDHDAKYDSFAATADAMVAHEVNHTYIDINGQTHLFSYRPIEGNEGWSIAIGAPAGPLVTSIVGTIAICGSILLACTILVLVIVFMRSKSVCKPIVECADRLEKFANGDISSPAPVCTEKNETKLMADSLARMITTMNEYIGDIRTVLTAISNGNLTVTPSAKYSGDFESIKSALDLILSSLNKFICSVERSANEVSEGANQLSEGSQSLSQSAITQASAVEEITSTVINIAEKTESNTKDVKKALELSRSTDSQAQVGTQRMQEMLGAITEIEESANEIEHIIKVIDDIAFQTNILALNAAIEAARAGEAGKGFAVVADEVGNLASKSQDAAKQTGALITKSIEAVRRGAKLADDTSEVLSQIVSGVQDITDLMNEISAANDDQTAAVGQVSTGMESVNSVIHTTTATAEQSAAASEELSALATTLSSEVSQFQTVK